MADVMERLLLGLVKDVIDHVGKIDRSHFVPTKVPEYALMRGHFNMFAAVGVASEIAHPHVIPSIGE